MRAFVSLLENQYAGTLAARAFADRHQERPRRLQRRKRARLLRALVPPREHDVGGGRRLGRPPRGSAWPVRPSRTLRSPSSAPVLPEPDRWGLPTWNRFRSWFLKPEIPVCQMVHLQPQALSKNVADSRKRNAKRNLTLSVAHAMLGTALQRGPERGRGRQLLAGPGQRERPNEGL